MPNVPPLGSAVISPEFLNDALQNGIEQALRNWNIAGKPSDDPFKDWHVMQARPEEEREIFQTLMRMAGTAFCPPDCDCGPLPLLEKKAGPKKAINRGDELREDLLQLVRLFLQYPKAYRG